MWSRNIGAGKERCVGWASSGRLGDKSASQKTITRPHLQRLFLLFLRPTVKAHTHTLSDNKNKEKHTDTHERKEEDLVKSSTTRHVVLCE